jgi:hypothetical protein
MFLESDEHIIIMEDTYLNPYTITDVSMLIDAGIKTVHINDVICWNELANQYVPGYNWSALDKRIEKYLFSDLKIILPFFFTMPDWFPSDWYYIKGKIPNYANKEMCAAIDDFAYAILDYYSDIKDRVQFTFAIPSDGEFLWDAMIENNYPFSDDVIAEFIINRQKILIEQHNEMWIYLHTFLGAENSWNRHKLPILYQALRNEFGDIPFYSIQFAHFATGNHPTNPECQSKVAEYKDKFGIQFFIGSQYCEGLVSNFDKTIQQKVRGFITCPNMSFSTHRHVEPWMVETIRNTNQKFNEVYHEY